MRCSWPSRTRSLSRTRQPRLKVPKRAKPIRLTPTFEQFKAIVASIRAQRFNREAEQSGDFVEFLGLAGLGQAEAASITRAHVDLGAGRSSSTATKPIPALSSRSIRSCVRWSRNSAKGRRTTNGCSRSTKRERRWRTRASGLAFLNSRTVSFRRMFITRAIERGMDVKVIGEWQGHRDGGKLILQTYSHVRAAHSERMAQC